VVKANVLAMDSDINHRFLNVGSGLPTSVLDLANLIIEISGLSLEPIHGPELSGDVKATQSDIELIRKLLNWEPKMKLDDWLTKIISNNDFQDI
jgi:nucleoside-diphosphate-sugar epimerase